MKNIYLLIIILISATYSFAQEQPSVFFENLKEGQVIGTSYMLKMGAKGIKVAPAGQVVEGEGHHHLVINGGYIEKGNIIPFDEKHVHFGKGQTEYELLLKQGKYTLTLQFANGAHLSYGKELSSSVNIEVVNDIKTQKAN